MYQSDLETFLKSAEQHRARLLLHAPNPILMAADARRQDCPPTSHNFARLPASMMFACDHYQYWSTTHKSDKLVYLLSDGAIHPNQYGHVELAKLMFQKLGIFDPASRTCDCPFRSGDYRISV